MRTIFNNYKDYSVTHARRSGQNKEFLRLYKTILRNLPDARGNNVALCDLGCGCGEFVKYVFNIKASPFSRLYGFDFRAKTIEVKKGDVQLSLSPINIVDSELPKATVYVLYDVLEHLSVDESIKVLKKIQGATMNESFLLVIHLPNGNSPFSTAVRYSDLTHKLSYTPLSLKQLLIRAGLTNGKVTYLSEEPIIGSLNGLIRFFMWRIIEAFLLLIDLVERGIGNPPYTRNFLALYKSDK